jgi:RNA-directed DNA polymerase
VASFDNIDHAALLEKLQTFPTVRRTIKGWLTAGVMENLDFSPTTKGTPQGGVLSPLLANIALHGLEDHLRAQFPPTKQVEGKQVRGWQPIVVRYADDFVILHSERGVIEKAQQIVTAWLHGLGLELKPSKTRITHTLLPTEEGYVGVDFLGWTFRQFPAGKYRTGQAPNGKPLGFKTIITPSKEAQRRHQAALAHAIGTHRSSTQGVLIGALNRIIRGWVNYHASSSAAQTFGHMSHLLHGKLWRWAKRRHPKKSARWIAETYWPPARAAARDFRVTNGPTLYRHTKKAIVHHVKVEKRKSPFDGDWVYWGKRLGRHPELSAEVARLLHVQDGRCPWCKLCFTNEDIMERDHIIPKQRKLKVGWSEKQLLHGHCHDKKTALEGSNTAGATDT